MCTVASKNEGIDALKDCIDHLQAETPAAPVRVSFPQDVEDALAKITEALAACGTGCADYSLRWLAIKALEDDMPADALECRARIEGLLRTERNRIRGIIGEEADIAIADSRYGFINAVCKQVIEQRAIARKSVSDAIDKIALSHLFGIPLFLLAMYGMFWLSINVAGCFIDFFDGVSAAVFVDGTRAVLASLSVPAVIVTLLADGIGRGIQTVASFVPPIFFLFACLSFLEDSGYMARAAFIMDRFMRAIGLPGKAFVPMIIGFGCNVPAILAARTLEDEKDRIATILVNPFMSCGARLPVYALFAAAFFPRTGGLIVFLLYAVAGHCAIVTAALLKRTVLKSDAASFIMELPPYHLPPLRGIIIHAWYRLKGFVMRAGKAIVLVVFLLTCLNVLSNATGGTSIMNALGKKSVPVFRSFGVREDNWPAAVGIFMGFFAKEAVIGTLEALYPQTDTYENNPAARTVSIPQKLEAAVASVPRNIRALNMPFSFGEKKAAGTAAQPQTKLYEALHRHFDGKRGAFAYLLMILLYVPCVATVAAVHKEIGWKWAVFSICYMTGVAWAVATVFYQSATVLQHPATSFSWIAVALGIIVLFYGGLRWYKRA